MSSKFVEKRVVRAGIVGSANEEIFTELGLTFAGMYILLVSIIIGLFVAMLFVNIYFRAKVLKVYGVLVRNRVQFGAEHIFNRQKLESEILPRYPQFRNEIESFIRHMRYTIKMATVLIALITAFGAVLMYFK